MEVSQKGGKIILRHQLKKNETYKITEGSKFKSLTIYNKPQIVRGFSNHVPPNEGIIVIDYDGCEESIVLEDYKFIQDKYDLPPAYMFQTQKDNYHIICLKKFVQSQIAEILRDTRCDNNFKTMPLRNPHRSYVLRLSDKKGSKKPKFIKMIGNEWNLDGRISKAHLLLLKQLYPKIKHPKYLNLDKNKEVKFHTYETAQ